MSRSGSNTSGVDRFSQAPQYTRARSAWLATNRSVSAVLPAPASAARAMIRPLPSRAWAKASFKRRSCTSRSSNSIGVPSVGGPLNDSTLWTARRPAYTAVGIFLARQTPIYGADDAYGPPGGGTCPLTPTKKSAECRFEIHRPPTLIFAPPLSRMDRLGNNSTSREYCHVCITSVSTRARSCRECESVAGARCHGTGTRCLHSQSRHFQHGTGEWRCQSVWRCLRAARLPGGRQDRRGRR